MQKKYQTLRPKNLRVAHHISDYLKEKKVMSEETFGDLYCQASPETSRGGSFPTLIKTTKKFLFDHNMMTTQKINGLIVYVSTQKCFRTFPKNRFVEYQEVSNKDIDEAILYKDLNNDLIPYEFEGKVIAGILKLEGNHAKRFIELYPDFDVPDYIPKKFQILGTIGSMESNYYSTGTKSYLIKKVN